MPDDTPEYMMPAWVGALSWALGERECVDEFRRQTGETWQPAATHFESMIDHATGRDWAFLESFVLWFNVNVWGPIDGSPEEEG